MVLCGGVSRFRYPGWREVYDFGTLDIQVIVDSLKANASQADSVLASFNVKLQRQIGAEMLGIAVHDHGTIVTQDVRDVDTKNCHFRPAALQEEE